MIPSSEKNKHPFMTTLHSDLDCSLAWLNRLTLHVLTPIFLIASLSASTIAFFYPLEIETRESTVWLYVLAFRHGINIYDHSQVAFVNMNHGPFDPLFKFLIATLFPFLEPWQVTRFAVFLLPYIFLFVAWKLIANSSREALLPILYLAGIGYLFLVFCASEFLFTGRSDATAALFLLLLIYTSLLYSPRSDLSTVIYGFACGVLATIIVLTNWRITPITTAILLFSLLTYRASHQVSGQFVTVYLISYILASISIFSFILYFQFGFDLTLFYKHFFGFYSKDAGWASGPYNGSVTSFLWSLFSPQGGPLLPALTAYILIQEKWNPINRSWLLLICFSFISCVAAYYLNYYGGGQWYFIPFLLIVWYALCCNFTHLSKTRLSLLGVIFLILLCINFRAVLVPTLKRAIRMNHAATFMTQIRTLESTNTILSEDTFFFRTSYHNELIDMGDTVSVMTKSEYYGEEFNKTVKRYFKRTINKPPDYIVTGFTESPELKILIEEKYILIAEGPGNLTANYGNNSKLFKRKDLVIP
jgi:hypothetical protein